MSATRSIERRLRTRLASLLCCAALVLACAGCGESVETLEREANAYLAKGDRVSAAIQFKALLAREPGHAHAHLQLGKIAAEFGALADAEGSLRRALELGKPIGDVATSLGPVLLELEKYKELLELLEPGPKLSQPTDPETLAEFSLLRARAYLGMGDLPSAGTQFQLAMIAQPAKAKLGLARVAFAGGDRARADQLIEEVLASNPSDAETLLAIGELRRAAGDLDRALPHFAQAVKLQPDSANALLSYAIALINANRVDEAQPLLEKAKKLVPASSMLHFARALIECKARRYPKCGEALQQVFEITPRYMPAILLSGQLNFATGNYEVAQQSLVRYLERFPESMHARKLLAATLLAKSQPQRAWNVLRPVLGGKTADAEALGLAGQALLQLGHLRQAREALDKAVNLRPDNAEFRTALAMTHLAAGMRRRAEADFRAAIALGPATVKADYGLIMMLLAEKQIQPAREAASQVEKRLPKDPEAHMLQGVVARASGNAAGARQAFQQAVQLDAGFFPAIEAMAQMDAQDGKHDAARKRFQDVLRRNGTHLDAMLAMAQLELAVGRRAESLTWARQAAAAHPASMQALLTLADAQLAAGELDDAVTTAKQAWKERPGDARTLKLLGRVQMEAKDYAGAVQTFSSLVGAQPGSAEGYLLLASAHLAGGDIAAATAAARNALQRDPRSVEAQAMLGDMLLQAKRYSEALQFARQMQRTSPRSAGGFRLEGETLLAQGDARGAVKAFEAAAKIVPNGQLIARVHRALSLANPAGAPVTALEEWVSKNPDDGDTRMYLADALNAKGRHKDAIAHYQELVRRDPKDARALNNLAWALHAVGDAQALNYAEQAYQLRPTEAAVVDTFGLVLVNRGRMQEGIQMLLKAVTLDAKNLEIRYHLAQALAQAGDKSRARAELKTILAAGKPFPHADEARALLATLGQ